MNKTLPTLLVIILIAIIIGGGVYFWQQSQLTSLQEEVEELQSENKELSEDSEYLQDDLPESKQEAEPNEAGAMKVQPTTDTSYSASSYCTGAPTGTAIGRDIYPINIEKYGDIGFLGELFTANDCGATRVSKIFGVNGGNYTLGPDIGLRNAPSKELLSVLQSIGFESGSTCNGSENRNTCTHWSLEKTVPLSEILRLKPYAKEIKSSGCIHCG